MRRFVPHHMLVTRSLWHSAVFFRGRREMLKPLAMSSETPACAVEEVATHPQVSINESICNSLDNLLGETASQRAAVTRVGSLPSYYKPMNLRGVLYEGDVAQQLANAAELRGFRSPVWATNASYIRGGYTVLECEVGVEVSTSMFNVVLYNLQQTNSPEADSCVALASVKATPLCAAGRPFSRRLRLVLMSHPFYTRFKSQYWVTEEEAAALGTMVMTSERGRCVPVPCPPAVTEMSSATSRDPRVEDSDTPPGESAVPLMLYNAEQLENPNAASSETCPRVECVNANGRRYSTLLTIHMRRYCQLNQLCTDPFATFVTCVRLRSLGGDIVPGAGVPLTLVVRDELLTLYHVDQTTISNTLFRQALSGQRKCMDRVSVIQV
ncbi:hypothetical protein DPX39_050040900 [Trypanosoma brucei equiperdum]|uniref:Trypanosoma Tc-38 (p38) protein domain-containing protein n=1 Tax=Trypanosoma brucei equiperdum TaxID=630700 RepID=A0A3L6L7F1_9TRYP|nr:hypothetical protein DPX39_050040900 [Trypanosoma brucei equiperdum]